MDNFSILPPEMISEILARLPAESVLYCKLVSKTWKNLIPHPSFSKMHSNRLIDHSVTAYTDSGKLEFLALGASNLYNYFEYIENLETPVNKSRRVNITPPLQYNYVEHYFIGSFNGLICLYQRGNWVTNTCIRICNPMTKEYVILPELPRNHGEYMHMSTGFGYLLSTNEYKVVVLNQLKREPNFVEVMVYTLGDGNIGKVNLKNDHGFVGDGVFANGALHWMQIKYKTILVFDLADENFQEHLSPPLLPGNRCYKVGVLGGFLFCALRKYGNIDDDDCDIWLYKKKNNNCDLKGQDEHHSMGWSKEYIVAINSKPVALTKSGSVLSYDHTYLDIYDPKASTSKRVGDLKDPLIQVFPHKNTLVSLKELGEEDTKIMQSLAGVKKKMEKKGMNCQTSSCS